MSAASFISMAGMMSFLGRDGAMYLMGWTGGYVLLALLLAPYLRKFGKYTVPDFVGERYYSQTRPDRRPGVRHLCLVHLCGRPDARRGGWCLPVFWRCRLSWAWSSAWRLVLVYAVAGGQKGITYTQVAQYCVLIFAYMLPSFFISLLMTDTLLPQIGFGAELKTEPGVSLLDKLDGLSQELGFAAYTGRGAKTVVDVFFITLSLMVGTRRPAARHHPLFYGSAGQGRPYLGRLGAVVHRHPVRNRAGRGSLCPHQSVDQRS